MFAEDAPAPITITVGDSSARSVASLTLSGTGLVNDTDFTNCTPKLCKPPRLSSEMEDETLST